MTPPAIFLLIATAGIEMKQQILSAVQLVWSAATPRALSCFAFDLILFKECCQISHPLVALSGAAARSCHLYLPLLYPVATPDLYSTWHTFR
jgi:hypothetical protein